jgi:hypothetical protein
VNGFSIYGPALEAHISKYTDVLVPGDLNHHIHSREPTNFHGAPSCIDLFCSNRPECVGMFSQIDVLVPGIPTTYVLIYGSYYIPSVANRDHRDFYRDFKHIDMVALLNEVRGLDWSNVYATNDVNDLLHFFNSSILTLFDNQVGLGRLRPRTRITPWFNIKIQRAICERGICNAVCKARRTDENRDRLRRMRKEVTLLMRAAKRSYMFAF